MTDDRLLAELAAYLNEFSVKVNLYQDEPGYTEMVDDLVGGRLSGLQRALRSARHFDLAEALEELLPFRSGTALRALETVRGFVLPELMNRCLSPSSPESERNVYDLVWAMLHARVVEVSRARFDAGHYADAVEAALKEVNIRVRAQCEARLGARLDTDGVDLMNRAFSERNPILELGNRETETGRSIQAGYRSLFVGAMAAVRNPKAHANISISANRAMHFLFLASLLMNRLEEGLDPM